MAPSVILTYNLNVKVTYLFLRHSMRMSDKKCTRATQSNNWVGKCTKGIFQRFVVDVLRAGFSIFWCCCKKPLPMLSQGTQINSRFTKLDLNEIITLDSYRCSLWVNRHFPTSPPGKAMQWFLAISPSALIRPITQLSVCPQVCFVLSSGAHPLFFLERRRSEQSGNFHYEATNQTLWKCSITTTIKNPNVDFTALGGNIFFSLCGMDKLRLKEANDLLNMMH